MAERGRQLRGGGADMLASTDLGGRGHLRVIKDGLPMMFAHSLVFQRQLFGWPVALLVVSPRAVGLSTI